MSLSPTDSEQVLANELIDLARDSRWRIRYDALERSIGLTMAWRHQVAKHYVVDTNQWVRSLARTLIDSDVKPAARSRRSIVHEFDQLLRGTKVTLAQRAGLISLFEDAQEAGSIGYLALSADRAARLVTAALSSSVDGQGNYLRQLDRFIRHLAAYASPISLDDVVASVGSVLEEVGGLHHVQTSLTGTRDVSVNREALTTALDELIANAEDAGATIVQVDVDQTADSLRARVANDGEPFGHLAQDRLFEPWYTTRTGRTGLGLHIARSVVSEAGGSLVARPNGQVSFEIVLPVRDEHRPVRA